mmetsp:Transcript_31940/g.73391  ORF Transcript_31940/g.73391 Transcript_31940/m.73391 type:complete len:93 (-) Transcript_31940:277-555(-)
MWNVCASSDARPSSSVPRRFLATLGPMMKGPPRGWIQREQFSSLVWHSHILVLLEHTTEGAGLATVIDESCGPENRTCSTNTCSFVTRSSRG